MQTAQTQTGLTPYIVLPGQKFDLTVFKIANRLEFIWNWKCPNCWFAILLIPKDAFSLGYV